MIMTHATDTHTFCPRSCSSTCPAGQGLQTPFHRWGEAPQGHTVSRRRSRRGRPWLLPCAVPAGCASRRGGESLGSLSCSSEGSFFLLRGLSVRFFTVPVSHATLKKASPSSELTVCSAVVSFVLTVSIV